MGGDGTADSDAFGVAAMLDSISQRGAQNAEEVTSPAGVAALASIGPKMLCKLHAYQARGVAWMVDHEAATPPPTLHPAWMELRAADGQHFYLHSYTGEASCRFFAAPEPVTCGGMLCDEVGTWQE